MADLDFHQSVPVASIFIAGLEEECGVDAHGKTMVGRMLSHDRHDRAVPRQAFGVKAIVPSTSRIASRSNIDITIALVRMMIST